MTDDGIPSVMQAFMSNRVDQKREISMVEKRALCKSRALHLERSLHTCLCM